MSDWIKELSKLLEESKNCRSGLHSHCRCWRCLESRKEEPTLETERQAAREAKIADEAFKAGSQLMASVQLNARLHELMEVPVKPRDTVRQPTEEENG